MNDVATQPVDRLLSARPVAGPEGRAALCGDPTVREAVLALSPDDALHAAVVESLVEAVRAGTGASRDRLALGELLSRVGDPRLPSADEPAYWADLETGDGSAYALAVYPVTNTEFRAFVDAGGYDDRALWSEAGWAWRTETEDTWPALAARPDVGMFTEANQPVVGVSLHEAEAYAAFRGARLPSWSERVHAVRGEHKRPYPWGSPFGEGHANTREEALERPCAVGLYRADCTPEGVYDLAGNVGEWTSERVGDEVLLHPGSWERPSLASWAKASTTAAPGARWSALGFRLARDR